MWSPSDTTPDAQPVALSINGVMRRFLAEPTRTLLETLREDLALTGAKRGCNQGVCGACTVLVDGMPARACLLLTATLDGQAVTTVEGLRDGDRLSAVQQALVETGAVQCGFCIPGIVVAAEALLRHAPRPTDDEIHEALSGHLCRCSGYAKLVEAVRRAAGREASP